MALLLVLLLSLTLVLPGIVVPAFAKIFVDEVLISRLDSWVMPLLIGLGLTALLRWVWPAGARP